MPRVISTLATWRPRPGTRARIFPPRDEAWRHLVPSFADCLAMARSGIPFQIVRARRYDRSGTPGRLAGALRDGGTIYLPELHQVLPRLARLMAALRETCLGPRREESSYVFLVEGRGREGMGLHHDGEVDSFWLQLEGRRTVTIGPPVRRGSAKDLALSQLGKGPGWWTRDLEPGSLFYMPPRTPHRVLCHGRSHAVSMTWSRAEARPGLPPPWTQAPGAALGLPRPKRGRLWTQIPTRPGAKPETLLLPGGTMIRVPGMSARMARTLSGMPSWEGTSSVLKVLESCGLVAPLDLPLRIVPAQPRRLDGWTFR